MILIGGEEYWPLYAATFSIAIAGLVITLFGAVRDYRTYRRERADRLSPEAPTLADKLADLTVLGERAAKLAAQVEAEILAQVATAARASQEAEQASVLAALTDDERIAIAALVRQETETGIEKVSRRERVRSFWTNMFFFAMGVVVSIAITLFIKPF